MKNKNKSIDKAYIVPYWINSKGEIQILMGALKETPKNTNWKHLPKKPYTFSLLGGTCEKGESGSACLIRELYEESTGYILLPEKTLNNKKTKSATFETNNGLVIKVFLVPFKNLPHIARSINHYHHQGENLEPEFLEYHFVKLIPLKTLLNSPNVYPKSFKPQILSKTKKWSENVKEYNSVHNNDKYTGIWYISKIGLKKILKLLPYLVKID